MTTYQWSIIITLVRIVAYLAKSKYDEVFDKLDLKERDEFFIDIATLDETLEGERNK